jgi:aspartyl-tRNA(Asn)/glutamyl-tRNA(Gln) amidotransferase subunit A
LTTPQPHEMTVSQAAEAIAQRSLSPVELMQSLLERSSAQDPVLRVWETLDEDAAMEAARRSEQAVSKNETIGRLQGVPFGIKDIFNTQGVRTSSGSPIYADFVPDHDSTAVARLKSDGAIVMGKTVTTEFASFDPPPTRNPWGLDHTPGGSSSGSAAGVAARLFPAALGSQTAGSVLRPASYNGVVGFKPTLGRISRYGVFPVSWSVDTLGYFTRSVEDAALLLDVLAGYDPLDTASSEAPVEPYRQAATAGGKPPRIGLVRDFFFERADADVRNHTERVAATLADAGARVEEIRVSADFDDMLAAHRVVMSVEMAAVHQQVFETRADDYAPHARETIEAGLLLPGITYVQSQRIRRRFRRSMEKAASTCDILLTPTTATAAPRDRDTTGDPWFQTPWTTVGFPTLTLPCGLSSDGMPLGIQLSTGRFSESKLLAAASWCETVLKKDGKAWSTPPDRN